LHSAPVPASGGLARLPSDRNNFVVVSSPASHPLQLVPSISNGCGPPLLSCEKKQPVQNALLFQVPSLCCTNVCMSEISKLAKLAVYPNLKVMTVSKS
jgi:hypothetical protein